MQLYVRPRRQAVPVAEAERLPGPFGLDGEGPERIGHLFLLHAAPERDGTQVVAVQPPRELPQHGMLGVGSHTLDHELVAGHAEGDRRSRSEEHTSELQSPCNLVCRLLLEKKKKHTLPPTIPIDIVKRAIPQ